MVESINNSAPFSVLPTKRVKGERPLSDDKERRKDPREYPAPHEHSNQQKSKKPQDNDDGITHIDEYV